MQSGIQPDEPLRCRRCGRALGGADPQARPYLLGRAPDVWCRACVAAVLPSTLVELDATDQLLRGPGPN